MKDKIQIVSLLLTRRCNLKCSYCAISRNYKNIPNEYPKLDYYHKNEMSTEFVINTLDKLKLHNKDIFILMYGGEPLMRSDLPDIINHCHDNDIHYTIISNNTDELEPALENLISLTGSIEGYTFSIDPLIVSDLNDIDRVKKSRQGLDRVLKYKEYINDLVAEVTIDKRNIDYIVPLVREMTSLGICSDLTFIDIAHSPYYDFSNISDDKLLVMNTPKLRKQFDTIYKENLNIHLGKTFYDKVLKVSKSNMDCGIEKDFHNLTIDADGSVRLCLRMRGVYTPRTFSADKIFMKDGSIRKDFKKFIKTDKEAYCRGCNHSCMIMSKKVDVNELIHSHKRK